MPKSKRDRKERDRQWHLLRSAKRAGLGHLPPAQAREAFSKMLAADGDCCGICGEKVELVADHDHGKRHHRGRLCHPCNTAIGLLKDDPIRLRAAADYLVDFENYYGEKFVAELWEEYEKS